ncbi:MAG: hypothetical protein JJ974_09050 [Phycisphaerales bacterium]|nr:hypothetical protein [Phycisphaerales bacterium]
MRILLTAVAVFFSSTHLCGCRSASDNCNRILPVFALDPEPLFTGKISLESDDAATRYLAIRDSITGKVSCDTHDPDLDRWDKFIAIRFDDESEDTRTYSDYLKQQQSLFDSIDLASRMDRFYQFDQPVGYFDGPVLRDDPRRDLLKTIRVISITLGDDAQRHWIEGNHDLAIRRIQTIFRIAKQIQLKQTAFGIDVLVAISVANVGLSRVEQMLNTHAWDDQDLLLFSQALSELDGDDPLGFYCERARSIRSYESWLKSQVVPQHGSTELWLFIARILGVSEIVNNLIQGPLGAPITVNLLSGDAEPSPVASDYFTAIDDKSLLDSIEDDLDGIDIQLIREKITEYEPLVDTVLSELDSRNPDLVVLKEIDTMVEDDESTISDILGISYISSMTRRYKGVLGLRDELKDRILSD